MKKWKTLSSRLALDHKWFKVRQDTVQLPNGKILDDYYIWQDKSVAQVIPVTKDYKLILEKQYKHAVGEFMIEYPAGYIDENEIPFEAAKRELLEETGYTSDSISFLAKFNHNPSKELGNIYMFIAKDVFLKQKPVLEITEDIELLTLSFEEVYRMIMKGEIWSTGTVAASFLLFEKLSFIKR